MEHKQKQLKIKKKNEIIENKEIFDELSSERKSEIYNMSKEINFNNLIYSYKNPNLATINFIKVKDPIHVYNEIKNEKTSLGKTDKVQKKLKLKLNEIITGNPKCRLKDQLNTITNIKILYNLREKVIKLCNNYAKIVFEAMHKTKHRKELKMLTPIQMLQRLPIALTQVKSGNNSENLLNEFRKIFHSLYQSKEITKNVYKIILKCNTKMDTIFMNSENSKTSKPHSKPYYLPY